ncbi:MAG TPA: SMP-30/gluconolactonase/LRE family protein [Thermoleophilaceae bacterium]|nr:SMP-30/gluconolactonase/LRE family protein [Thermoleophilaceae bacterium]
MSALPMERSLSILSPPRALPSVTSRPHGLLEAPRHGGDDWILYSDVLGGGVYRVPVDGDREPETVLPKRRGIGGLVPHRDGGIVVTGRGVVHVDGERQRELLSLDGVAGFNDLTTDSAGQVLTGALRFQPFAGEDPVPTEVWRIVAPGVAEVAAEGIDWPNGIAVTPDDGALYVSDTANGVVRVYAAGNTEGDDFASVSNGAVDGLALDEDGGLWVALGDGGIARFDADGNLDGFADIPSAFVSSLCFGGPDRRDVYITTADNPLDPEKGGTVFHARAEVAGVEVGAATV